MAISVFAAYIYLFVFQTTPKLKRKYLNLILENIAIDSTSWKYSSGVKSQNHHVQHCWKVLFSGYHLNGHTFIYGVKR